MVQRNNAVRSKIINTIKPPCVCQKDHLLRVVLLEQAPASFPSVTRIVACTLAIKSSNGFSAPSACSLLPGFQCLESFHLLKYVFEEFFSVYNVQMATDLGVFTCKLIELLLG